jgi:hypothetical protein
VLAAPAREPALDGFPEEGEFFMSKFLSTLAVMAFGLILTCASARAECDAGFVQANAGGTWQVNNAGGEGFGGWFVTEGGEAVHEDKPTVNVSAEEGTLAIGASGGIALTNFHDEQNPNGGTWCGFNLGDYAARIGHADNGWWILEVGNYDDRNKVELIRR